MEQLFDQNNIMTGKKSGSMYREFIKSGQYFNV